MRVDDKPGEGGKACRTTVDVLETGRFRGQPVTKLLLRCGWRSFLVAPVFSLGIRDVLCYIFLFYCVFFPAATVFCARLCLMFEGRRATEDFFPRFTDFSWCTKVHEREYTAVLLRAVYSLS